MTKEPCSTTVMVPVVWSPPQLVETTPMSSKVLATSPTLVMRCGPLAAAWPASAPVMMTASLLAKLAMSAAPTVMTALVAGGVALPILVMVTGAAIGVLPAVPRPDAVLPVDHDGALGVAEVGMRRPVPVVAGETGFQHGSRLGIAEACCWSPP